MEMIQDALLFTILSFIDGKLVSLCFVPEIGKEYLKRGNGIQSNTYWHLDCVAL